MFYGNIDCIITEFHEFLLAIKSATNQIFYCIETSLMRGSGCKAAGTLSTRDVSGGVSSARVVKLYHASICASRYRAAAAPRALLSPSTRYCQMSTTHYFVYCSICSIGLPVYSQFT